MFFCAVTDVVLFVSAGRRVGESRSLAGLLAGAGAAKR